MEKITLCCKDWIDWFGCLYAENNKEKPLTKEIYCNGGQDCAFGLWDYKVKD